MGKGGIQPRKEDGSLDHLLKSKWKSGKTQTIRVPIVLSQDLMKVARAMDEGKSGVKDLTQDNKERELLDEIKKLKAEVESLDAENLKLAEQTADQNLVIQNLTSELELLRKESGGVEADRLQEIRDCTLASLKLGKQAPGYKAAKQVLDKFIESLN